MFAFCFWQPVASRFLTQMLCCTSVAVGLSCLAVPLRAQHRTVTVVQTGQQAPDGNGILSSFSNIGVNAAGQVWFTADLTDTTGGASDNRGVFISSGGGLTSVARRGQSAPNGDGIFSNFQTPHLDDFGRVVFNAQLSDTTQTRGLFQGSQGGIVQLVRTGQSVPDGNGTFSSISQTAFNGGGQVVFMSILTGTVGGGSDDRGLFFTNGQQITQVARTGQSVPGGNGVFASFFGPALDASGQIVFGSRLADSEERGIFLANGDAITQIARSGQVAPDGNGTFSTFGSRPLIAAEKVVFEGRLTGTAGGTIDDRGIYLANGSELTQIVRTGQSAPNENGRYSEFFNTLINATGQVAFIANLADTDAGFSDDRGVFLGNKDGIIEVVRRGDDVPDGNGRFGTTEFLRINDSGQVAFTSWLTGVGLAENRGIYTGDGVDLIQVVRRGDEMAGSVVVSVGGSNLNNHGQKNFRVTLADDRELVNLWTPDLRWRNELGGSWETAGAWTLSLSPAHVHDVFINPDSNLTITGPASDTVLRSLQLGGGAGEATLHLTSGVNLTATDGLTIADNGVLTGQGTITGDVTTFGTIRPGDSAGSLSFDGNLILESTSNLFIELSGFLDGEYDKFVVSGDLNLNGNLSVDLIDGHTLWFNQQYLIGEVGGSLAGQFFGLSEGDTVGNFGGMDLFISYSMGSGNSVGLFTAVPEPSSASLIVTAVSLFAFGRRRRHTVS
jgi:hypothetical protein